MRFGSALLTLVLLALAASSSLAQEYQQSGSLWQRYYFKARLSERFLLNVEMDRRTVETTWYRTQTLLPRIHVHYMLKNGMHGGIGVAHFMAHVVDRDNGKNIPARSELRFHQEWNMYNPMGRTQLSHRYQIEERLFMPYSDPNYALSGVPLEFGMRFRYQFQVQVRLTLEDKKVRVFLKLYDELLLQYSKARSAQPFEANRFYGGVQVKFSPVWSMEAGYLTWIQQRSADVFLVPHIARFTLQHTIDFRKPKPDV